MTTTSITPPSDLIEEWQAMPEYISELKRITLVTMTDTRLQMLLSQAASWGYQQALAAHAD